MSMTAGIVGWPVAHSLSPRLHGYWLDELNINAAYVPLAVARPDFARTIEVLARTGFVGVNVTVPHKQAALALAHVVDGEAQRAGAANLLLFHPDVRIEARNTDVGGLRASVREELGTTTLAGSTAAVIGAGGAARAAILALADSGLAKICILNRTASRAAILAAELQPVVAADLLVVDWGAWPSVAAECTLAVNATSAGMGGNHPLDLSLAALPLSAAVVDLVYSPLETPLLKQARDRGLKTVNGLGMLMHQAVPSFAAFYGAVPKVTPELRRVLEQALAP